jgi:hypothetical protein
MSLILIIIVLVLLFGGGGFYGHRRGYYGGGGLGGKAVKLHRASWRETWRHARRPTGHQVAIR